MVWQEDGKYPNLIVEVISNTTAQTDGYASPGGNRGLKKQIYQDIWRTPEYFMFDPYTLELQGVHTDQLRFFAPDGQLVPTPQEQAEQETQRAERLEAKLRELGIDPDHV